MVLARKSENRESILAYGWSKEGERLLKKKQAVAVAFDCRSEGSGHMRSKVCGVSSVKCDHHSEAREGRNLEFG
jgi:hypothetical protein